MSLLRAQLSHFKAEIIHFDFFFEPEKHVDVHFIGFKSLH